MIIVEHSQKILAREEKVPPPTTTTGGDLTTAGNSHSSCSITADNVQTQDAGPSAGTTYLMISWRQ